MVEIIGFVVFSLCLVAWLVFLLRNVANKKRINKDKLQLLEKQEEVESRIRKIEDVYGEEATLIMFQELQIPTLSELLIILEEAQIILIFGEAYNFSEILNIKIGKSDYIRLKHTAKKTSLTNILEQTAAGHFSANTIKGALKRLEETQEPITSPQSEDKVKIEIMTSRAEGAVISIYPSCYTVDEVVVALSIIIDKNENKWASMEIPQKS